MGKETVVLDLGSAFVKCGFAGESAPRCILPSPLDGWLAQARPSSSGGNPGWGVAEWEEMLGPYLVRLYLHHLKCRPKDRKVVVCEPLAGPAALREALARVLFHWVKAPALLVAPALITALHATGADGGLVVDVGHRESHVLAVAHGRPLLHTYQVAGVGARAVAERVQGALGGESRVPWGVAQDIVVRACFVRSAESSSSSSSAAVTSLEYDGGVGQTIDISADMRGAAAEVLFAEDDEDSLPAALLRCLKKCPRDLRRGLASHILLIGGGAMLPGLCARLAEELRRRARSQARYQELAAALSGLCVVKDACVLAPRSVLAWTGASVLAVLEEAVGGSSSISSTSIGASSRSASGLGRSRMGSQDSGGESQSRFLSRADYIEAETLKQQQGGRGAGSVLPEWLAVANGGEEGAEGPN